MNKLKAELKRIRLALLFALVVFAIITLTAVIMFAFFHIRSFFGIEALGRDRFSLLVRFSFFNIIAGTIIAAVFSRLPLSPLRKLITAADRLSNGDFGVRIHLRGIRDLQDLSDSFNHMAEELGSIEMLRADFVNNFSHEFKTPIVSVRGFAKVLKRGDLSDSEREEYLDIIISESERLSALAENVLSLSRLETQTILTHKELFNVSEQLRQA
ncbi:MAG: HAMP domain-containing histidine kinase, partial [Oscillospiraceae bacterium]|nr:HAMP domain-containing histidine kinase [Oscillospiraceae bacterium]